MKRNFQYNHSVCLESTALTLGPTHNLTRSNLPKVLFPQSILFSVPQMLCLLFSALHLQLPFPAVVVINGVLTTQKLRFQGEALGSHAFVILFMVMPYFIVQLTNSKGGFVCVPGEGRIRHIPTLQSSYTLPSGIRKLKHLLDCKGRFLTSSGVNAYLLAIQQAMIRKCW